VCDGLSTDSYLFIRIFIRSKHIKLLFPSSFETRKLTDTATGCYFYPGQRNETDDVSNSVNCSTDAGALRGTCCVKMN